MFTAAAIALVLAAPCLPQDPPTWIEMSSGRVATSAETVVHGRVELRPVEADAAAEEQVLQEFRWDLERAAREHSDLHGPAWLPSPLVERRIDGWLRGLSVERTVEVVDRFRQRHDHGDYESFQTHLLVRPDPERRAAALANLDRSLSTTVRRLGWWAGGSLGLWGLLAFAWMWFDRLTRGYMTGRLGSLCVGMGVAVPGIAWLFL